MLSIGESAGYKTKVRDMIEIREKGALRCKVDKEEHLKIYGGLKEGIGMKEYLHGPLDAAKNLKLRFRVGDLDLPERRKRYVTKSRRHVECISDDMDDDLGICSEDMDDDMDTGVRS